MVRSLASVLVAGTLCVPLVHSVGCESVGDVVSGVGGEGSGASMLNVAEAVLGDWSLAGINGGDIAALAGELPSMNISPEGTASGFTGANRWTSALDLDALALGGFDLGPTATTRMAGSPEAMGLESQFLSALNGVTGLDVGALSDGVLRLLGGDGGELLRFVRGG